MVPTVIQTLGLCPPLSPRPVGALASETGMGGPLTACMRGVDLQRNEKICIVYVEYPALLFGGLFKVVMFW